MRRLDYYEEVGYDRIIAFEYLHGTQETYLLRDIPHKYALEPVTATTYNPFQLFESPVQLPPRVHTVLNHWPMDTLSKRRSTAQPTQTVALEFDGDVSGPGWYPPQPRSASGGTATYNKSSEPAITVWLESGFSYHLQLWVIVGNVEAAPNLALRVNNQLLPLEHTVDRFGRQSYEALIPASVIDRDPWRTVLDFEITSAETIDMARAMAFDALHIDPVP